jgi:hypothetical protein
MTVSRIALLFVSETWCAEGTTGRHSSWIAHSVEHPRVHIYGRISYGEAIFINPALESPADLVIVSADQSDDKAYITVRFRGILMTGVYLRPPDVTEWVLGKLESLSEMAFDEEPYVVFGDFNIRHREWRDHATNTSGSAVFQALPGLGLTRVSPVSGRWT